MVKTYTEEERELEYCCGECEETVTIETKLQYDYITLTECPECGTEDVDAAYFGRK